MKKILSLFVLLISVCAAESADAWEYVEMRTAGNDQSVALSLSGMYRGKYVKASIGYGTEVKGEIVGKAWDQFVTSYKLDFGGRDIFLKRVRKSLNVGLISAPDWMNDLGARGYELIDVRRFNNTLMEVTVYLFKRKRD